MTPYQQTKTTENGERGNCLATSIGCLLDIDPVTIPAFEEMSKDAWRQALFDFLSAQGKRIITTEQAPEGFAIAVGWREDGVLHAVIVNNGVFYHDPNPTGHFVNTIRNYWQLIDA